MVYFSWFHFWLCAFGLLLTSRQRKNSTVWLEAICWVAQWWGQPERLLCFYVRSGSSQNLQLSFLDSWILPLPPHLWLVISKKLSWMFASTWVSTFVDIVCPVAIIPTGWLSRRIWRTFLYTFLCEGIYRNDTVFCLYLTIYLTFF